MRENYTSFSSFEHAKSGTANLGSGSSPGGGLVLKRTRNRASFKNVLSSGKQLSSKLSLKLALMVATMFILLSHTTANAQCTAAPAVVGVGDITPTSAVINWNIVASGNTYTVDVATDNGFTNIVATASSISTLSYQVTGLTENATYYFRIKVDNTTCGDYSTTTSFVPSKGVYTPLTTSGYTQDVIANGTGAPTTSAFASVDNGNFVYYAMGYRLNASSNFPATNSGVPINRVITTGISGMQFYMQDYNGNNSLRLPTNGNTGDITLTYPQKVSTIYVMVTSGSGAASLQPTLFFSDGTSYSGTAATTLINWDSTASTAVPATSNAATLNRIDRTSTTATAPTTTGAFKLFYFTITVPVAYQNKLLSYIRFTKAGTAAAVAHVFGLNAKTLGACPVMSSVSSSVVSTTSFTANWVLGALAADGVDPTYTLEVYSDSGYTTPVAGSPFTGLTGSSYTVTGLPADGTYYYRVKADGTSCSSAYVTGSQSMTYCSVTTSTTYYNTNFTTVGGTTNINNTTGAATANYSATQAVTVQAGSSFTFTGTKSAGTVATGIFVDWNDDLDFADAGETIAVLTGSSSNGLLPYSGVITVPAGTAVGTHRLRVRSVVYSSTPAGCSVTGETEDYSLTVTAASGTCVAPDAPASVAFSGITTSNITATVTAAGGAAPAGYLVVRSLSSSLSAGPVSGTSYAVGGTLGGGTVVAVSSAAPAVANFVASNTGYYFYVYAFNNGSCVGPVYSAATTGFATTCATAAIASAASNVKNSFGTLNWASLKGTNGNPVTYTVETYTDSGLTTLFDTYTVVDQISYNLTGLTANATYYYRVTASVPAGCGDAAYSSTISFKAENNFSPINLTGFNADVIAEGSGWATVSTTSDVDGGGYVYMARDYKPNSTSNTLTTGALPVNRTMASPNNTGLNFLMPDYKSNNSVRLTAAAPSQDLVFAVPTKLTNLYLAVTSGGGSSSITGTIYFDDNTTQAISSTAVPDWFATSGAPVLAYNIGRVNKNTAHNEAEFTGTTGITQSNAKIFQLTIAIQAANQSKKVTKVNITRVASGTALPNIFAISGQVIGDCPTLNSVSATAASSSSATVSWVLGTAGDGGTPTYTVVTYSDAAHTTVVSTNSGITGTSYTVTGLNPSTTYYFGVTGTSVCDSNTLYTSATTMQPECTTPGDPTFTATGASSTGITGTIGAPTPSAIGYLVIRSTSASLGAVPANFTTYTVGTAIGAGSVIYVGTSTSVADTTGASNTHYYYYIYAYNSGTSCSGPIYSVNAATADVTSCVAQALVVGASNIKNSSATLNWTSVTGGGASSVTYNLEVYTDASYTTLFTSFTGLTDTKQSVAGLTANATYYYRVQAASSGACSSSFATGSFVATNGYTPIDVTSGGYNQDVIANGVGAAQYSTTASVDASGAGNAYVSLDYVTGAGTATTVGLPVNRFLASTTTSGLNFIIPDYNGNNSLRLPAQNDTGTLTFETAVKLTDIYIATTGGSGGLTASAEIIFSDGGASQITTGIAIPDWVSGSGSVIVNNLGRANRTNTTGAVEILASKIFQVAIPISAANQSRKVSAVKFTKTSTGATEPVLNIFAISGKIIGDCPTMASTSVGVVEATGATLNWVLGAEGDGGTPTYTVEVYTDAAYTNAAITPISGLTDTTYAVTGLTSQTTYYYRVKATNAACESPYVTGTFTTSQVPATLNWTADFEGTTYWSLVNGTQTNKWVIGSATAATGTKSLYISNDGGTTNAYTITSASTVQAYRDIAIPAGTTTVEFSFDWKAYGEGTSTRYDYFRVWMVPTSYIPTAGTQITAGSGNIQIGGYFNVQSTYTNYYTPTLDVSSFAGQSVRLVFEWRNDTTVGTQPAASIDNVYMGIPTCLTPSNLAPVSTLTSSTLTWTAPTTAPSNGYEYYYSTTNTAPVAATAGTAVETTTATITGLTSDTTFYYWVRSVCDAGDKSAWVSGGTFYTGYCTPTYSSCDSTHRITLVTVSETSFSDDLSSVTACSTAATNRTSTLINVTQGNTYTINATVTGYESVGLAVDFNSNGNFADSGEIVALATYQSGNPQLYSMSLPIPSGLAPGNYRLRLWNREANAGAGTNPCGSYGYGTYVDYTLVVAPPCYTWMGTVSTDWTNTANWCDGLVPTAESDVVIAPATNTPHVPEGVEALAHNLTIGEGASLIVETGATLNVDNILAVHPDGLLTVRENGALLQGAATVTNANSGEIEFHKNSNELYRLDYTMWSAPITGQTLYDFSPTTSSNRFYQYKTLTDVYSTVDAENTFFEPGKGYLIRMPNLYSGMPGYAAGTTSMQFLGVFNGAPNNGTITKEIATTGNGFNAVGNPYPSPLNLHDFLFANSTVLDGTSGIYLWRKKNDGASTSYATLSLAAFTANPATGGGSENSQFYVYDATTGSDNWLLAPGQGFIVKALTGGSTASLTFTNEMRRPTPGTSQSFFRPSTQTASRMWLNLTATTGGASQAAIAYMDNTTMGLDFGYDARRFTEPNTVAFYSLAENTSLTVQARPAFVSTDVVPMGYVAPQAGSYTISIDHLNGVFANGQAIYVRDNVEGIVRNLNEGGYAFATEAGTFNDRFEILYNYEALGTDNPVADTNAVAVFKQGNTIQINAGSTLMNGVTIYDIRGRKVYSLDNINTTQTAITNLTAEQQVLIVEVNTVKGKVSKRIVF